MRAPFDFPEPEKRSIENPNVRVSAENFLAFFGVQSAYGPAVTLDNAMTVPAVAAAVSFLSRTLAALPLHAALGAEAQVTGGEEPQADSAALENAKREKVE